MLKILIKIFKRFGALKGSLILLALAIIALPLLYCFLIYGALYAELRPSKNSQNIAATSTFIDGYFFIHIADSLRWAFNYDSVFLRPLFAAAKERFNEATKLLPKDSIEDVMWWVNYYKHIYNLTGNRSDDSLLRKLNDADYERVWSYIQRLPYGKIYNDAPLLKDWRLPNMLGLVDFYVRANLERDKNFVLQHPEQASEISAHLRAVFKKYYQISPGKTYFFDYYSAVQIFLHTTPMRRFYYSHRDFHAPLKPEDYKLPPKICKQMAQVDIEQYFHAAIVMSKENKVFFESVFRMSAHYLNALFAYCPERRAEREQLLDDIIALENQYQKGELNEYVFK